MRVLPNSRRNEVCLYCPNLLKGADKEHLFLQGWGGIIESSNLICSDCNSFFSGLIDTSFNSHVKIIRNTWGITTDRNRSIPEITSATQNYKIGPYGQPTPDPQPEVIAELDEEGKLSVVVKNIKSKTHTKKLLKDFEAIEKQIGSPLTETQKQALEEGKIETLSETGKITVYRHDEINIVPEFQYRCIANTAMKVLSYYIPNIANDKAFNGIKNFIRNGGEDYLNHACVVNTHDDFTLFQNRFGSVKSNSVEIYFTPQLGKVIAVVTILSTIRRAIILSKEIPSFMKQDEFFILRAFEPLIHTGRLDSEVITFPLDATIPNIISITETIADNKYMDEDVQEFIHSQYVIEPAVANLLANLRKQVIGIELSDIEQEQIIADLLINFVDECLRREKFEVVESEIITKLDSCDLHRLLSLIIRKKKLYYF